MDRITCISMCSCTLNCVLVCTGVIGSLLSVSPLKRAHHPPRPGPATCVRRGVLEVGFAVITVCLVCCVCVCVCVRARACVRACVRAARLAPLMNCCSIWQESVQEVETGLARAHMERTGMVNVKNRRCLHPNCTKQPLFGPPPYGAVRGDPGAGCVGEGKQGRRTEAADRPKTTGRFGSQAAGRRGASKAREPRQQGAIYCAEHKLEGYIDVKHRRCRGPVSLSDALANIPLEESATGPNATGVFGIGAGDAGGQGVQRVGCQRQPTFGPPGSSCPCSQANAPPALVSLPHHTHGCVRGGASTCPGVSIRVLHG